MWYFKLGSIAFLYYLTLFLRDKTTPKNDTTSWIAIFIASLFWIIVVPISFVELSFKFASKRKKEKKADFIEYDCSNDPLLHDNCLPEQFTNAEGKI